MATPKIRAGVRRQVPGAMEVSNNPPSNDEKAEDESVEAQIVQSHQFKPEIRRMLLLFLRSQHTS